ncbi:MAG: TetR/AcrR family transcriptional regulator [Paracoccaceae bacterium]
MQLAVNPNTQLHADQRIAEILASVRQAFVEKGFDGASMQDLARAAGMSVGNFYRYFPSKAAIIQGMIALDLAEIQRDFAAIIGSNAPMETLRGVIKQRLLEENCDQDGELWTEIQAAARRSPEIGAASQQMEAVITGCLLDVFCAETGLSQNEAAARFSASAAFIMVLFKSAACLNCAVGLDQNELKMMIVRTINQTLDDVATSARKA